MSRSHILVDGAASWEKISQLAMPDGERRTYYLAVRPYRALLVVRNGLALGDLVGRVVDAQIGRDRADPGFAREPGVEQLKISIYRATAAPADDRLSSVLRRAPRRRT